jgi:hypothetical protein
LRFVNFMIHFFLNLNKCLFKKKNTHYYNNEIV